MSARLFPLGRTAITPRASEHLGQAGVLPHDLLNRHVSGDFGDLEDEDLQANREAVTIGRRIFSAYELSNGTVWVITEADRSVTTILLPSDY